MHFWLGTVGILIYMVAMYVSGITQGLMLGATKESGTVLVYPNFIEAVTSTKILMASFSIGTIPLPLLLQMHVLRLRNHLSPQRARWVQQGLALASAGLLVWRAALPLYANCH